MILPVCVGRAPSPAAFECLSELFKIDATGVGLSLPMSEVGRECPTHTAPPGGCPSTSVTSSIR